MQPQRTSTSAAGALKTERVTRFAVQRDAQRGLTGTLEYNSRYSLKQNHETSVSWAGDVTTATRVAEPEPNPALLAVDGKEATSFGRLPGLKRRRWRKVAATADSQ
jgi:hypothetical protein